MSEAQEQCAVIEWADLNGIPIFAIPNGGRRDPKEAAHLKRQGVRAGVPDLFLPVAAGSYHGLFIEMKAGKNRATRAQESWLRLLRGNGYASFVCYGADSAIECIKTYTGMSVCEDCDSHYEWWQAFQNPNPHDCCNLRM